MRSCLLGRSTSRAEVQGISRHGIWLFARGQEFLLPFKNYPDLDLDSLEHPEKYPLVAKKSV
jgi:hypothetical protein